MPNFCGANDMRRVRLDQLGMTVRAKRSERGMTQRDLGALVGVSRQTIARLESGESDTTVGVLYRTLRALDVQLAVEDATADNSTPPSTSESLVEAATTNDTRVALTQPCGSATKAAMEPSAVSLAKPTQQAIARAFEGLAEITVPASTQQALHTAIARLAETALPLDTRAAISRALNQLWVPNASSVTGDALDRNLENMAKAVLEQRDPKS